MKPEEQVIELVKKQIPGVSVRRSGGAGGFYRFTDATTRKSVTMNISAPPNSSMGQLQMEADEIILAINRAAPAPVKRSFKQKIKSGTTKGNP